MLWSLWSTCLCGSCRTLLPSSQAAEHWCCYHWEIISIDCNLEWHRKPGLFFCLLSSLQRVFYTGNSPLQVGTRTQRAEVVKGGLGEGCELCREASRTQCEQLGTKQKRVTAWGGKNCPSCPPHYHIKLLLTTWLKCSLDLGLVHLLYGRCFSRAQASWVGKLTGCLSHVAIYCLCKPMHSTSSAVAANSCPVAHHGMEIFTVQ